VSELNTSEKKILAAITENPGLLWHEAGEQAYPNSTVRRLNLWGKPFRKLTGRAVDYTHRAVGSLEAKGLIRKDPATHRYWPSEEGAE
jgi:hypothetical protein